jgi:hypothetical protein
MTTQPISALRQRMIEDMTIRRLASGTQANYLGAVARFAQHFGRSPDRLTYEDVRAYQQHLVQSGATERSVNRVTSGLRFLGLRDAPKRIVRARESENQISTRRGPPARAFQQSAFMDAGPFAAPTRPGRRPRILKRFSRAPQPTRTTNMRRDCPSSAGRCHRMIDAGCALGTPIVFEAVWWFIPLGQLSQLPEVWFVEVKCDDQRSAG